jgi:3-hydroxyacyl-CoA dehydrogenase
MLLIRKAAVLGAGRMGTAVAAHLANAGIPTLLLDLAPTELTEDEQKKKLTLDDPKVRNRLAEAAIAAAAKGRPAAFAHPSRIGLLTPGNFDDDLSKLADIDWVIEAVVERLDVKRDLLARVAQNVGPRTIVSTNSSGLSVNTMAEALPDELKTRFLGSHFFFPPRYMYLLELIPGEHTDPAVVDRLREFSELRLGKGVILSNDRPNFVANRIGIFSTVYAINAMHRYWPYHRGGRRGERPGPRPLGHRHLRHLQPGRHRRASPTRWPVTTRPPSTTRCANSGVCPEWILEMVKRGYLGEKVGGSFFREKRTLVIDPATLEYRPWQDPRQPSIAEANKISDPVARVKKFISFDDDAARFGWDLLAATFVYSANRVPEICSDITAIDRSMRWGYAWDLGPFELWDALGVKETVERMQAEGRAVPEWVRALAASDDPRFYKQEADRTLVWGPGQTQHKALSPRPRTIILADLKRSGKTLDHDDHASLIDLGDRVACIEFHTKANTVGEGVQLFIEKAIRQAGDAYDALVIGNQGAHFSAGADIKLMVDKVLAEDWDGIDHLLRTAQRVGMAIKYAPIPIVAAPFGRVLGGGLEVCLHCHRVQAHADVAMGLVETGVGLVPAAGGMKEAVFRTMAPAQGVTWQYFIMRRSFDAITQAKISSSAWEAFDLGYLRPGDDVTMDKDGLIYAAKQVALGMVETGWQTPAPVTVKVMGRDGIGNYRGLLDNMRKGDFISDHDRYLAGHVAYVLSGGDIDIYTEVDEQYLLDLERRAFLEVCRTPKTVERMQAMLNTGRPLRN